jgi:acyl-coenzyme A synthetase/AMP-(fatty) acid ligase
MSVPVYDLIAFQARIRPEAPAVFCPQGIIRFRDLLIHIDTMIAELESHGITGSEPVALIFPRCYVHLLLIIALDRMNVASVSLLAPNSKIPWTGKNPIVVFSNKKPELDIPHRWIDIPEKWTLRGRTDAPKRRLNTPDALVRIILSSGSTGSPKPIAIRRSALAVRIAEHIRDLGLTHSSRVMSMHQLSGGPGYWTSLATLAAGGMLILLKQLQDCVQNAEILKATHLSCSPFILANWIEQSKKFGPLNSLQILETAGSHLPLQVARQAHNVVSPSIYTLYGATEVGRIAFTKAASIANIQGAVGYVSPWCTVEVVDDLDTPLELGREGIVRVRTTGIVDSYYEAPEMTAKHLRDGWFYPGDIGVLNEDGLLKITSRTDDVVNLGGIKVSPLGAEEALRSVYGVQDVAAFVVPAGPNQVGRLWAAVIRGGAIDPVATKAASRAAKVARVVYVDALPRNEGGKVLKRKLAEAAANILAKEASADAVQKQQSPDEM